MCAVHTNLFQGSQLDHIAFPLGGMGSGMICLEGNGNLSRFSLRHRPKLLDDPPVFAAISFQEAGIGACCLQGPVQMEKSGD
jgi:hypothetical protein